MTSTKAIITIVIIWIITVTAGLFEITSASYECLNLEISQAQFKQAKTLKEKVQARKAINNRKPFCLSNQYK